MSIRGGVAVGVVATVLVIGLAAGVRPRDAISADHDTLVADGDWASPLELATHGTKPADVARPGVARQVGEQQPRPRARGATAPHFDALPALAAAAHETSTLRGPLDRADPWTQDFVDVGRGPAVALDRANPWTGRFD